MFKTENTVEMLSLTTVSDVFPPRANLEVILKEKFSTAYFIATISLKNRKMKEIYKFISGAEPSDFKTSTEFTSFNFRSSL